MSNMISTFFKQQKRYVAKDKTELKNTLNKIIDDLPNNLAITIKKP